MCNLNSLLLRKQLKFVLKLSPFARDAGPETCTPLLDKCIDNDLVRFILSLQDTITQFVNIPYLPPVNFLLHFTPNGVVDGIQIRAIWRPH